MFKLTSNSDSEPVEAVKETFDNETNNLNGCKSLTEVEKINESMDDVNESIEDEPQEQSIVNTEENQVTGENNVTEENKANEKNKVAEEIKTTEENKVTEGSKVTELHKVTEENKITEENKVAWENEVFHENEIDDSFRGFDKSSEDAFRIIDKVRSLIKTEDEKVLKQRALMKDEPLDIDFYPAGTTEALGKGKRARVPNKRYSDILLSPHSRKSGLENGNYEKYDYENNSDNSGKDEPGLSIIGPSSSGSTLKKRKMSSDLSGTKYLRSPKLTSPKVSSPKLTNLKGNRYKARNSRVWQTKEGLHDTADSPPKNKTPKGKAPMMKDVEKKSADPPSTKGRRGRKKSFEDNGSDVVGSAPISKPCQPCSIRCKGLHGMVPTLQCRICLCLYHHDCVGVSPVFTSLPYVCKNCHYLDGQEQAPIQSAPLLSTLPPLTPINVINFAGNQPNSLPKLQRFLRPTDTDAAQVSNPLFEPPKLVPRQQVEEMKSLVGSLTTWLPHNSKIINSIQEAGKSSGITGVPRPQYVEILAGRKFLVIPKHNFMSISPNVAATAFTRIDETPLSVDSASLGSDAVCEIKVEPDSPSKPENSLIPETMEVDSGTKDNEEPTEDEQSGTTKLPAAHKTPVSSPAATNNTTSKKRTIKLSSITNSEEKEINFMDNYLQNLSYGYNTLLYVFQYLKVQDLLRAGCVCSLWRDLASHRLLWRTVRMKNSQVHSFEGLANSLKKHGTVHLDLRKMLLPNGGDEIWPEFSQAIAKVETLRRIELCRCPSSVVENLGASNPLLEVINAVTIKCESMNLEPLRALKQIKELRLKSTGGLILSSNIDALKDMNSLKYLSLTSIRDLDKINLIVIAELSNLESLELGECTDFPKSFGGEVLLKLRKLERLRLEKGQGNCHTFEILDAVKQMDSLEQLELVNFDIKAGFDKALGTCLNIKKFLIIPTYISQSATTNHMVLGGVIRLQKTLSHFVWGVTLELLRVTELFVDQCEDSKEKKDKRHTGNGDCIPVLKPIPLIVDKDMKIPPALEPPQVEILALPSLQKLLMQNLPATRVKILKIPFHATWRQSIMDSVN